VCGAEYFNAPLTDDRVRLDPYDPSTFRHAGQCEHRDTTDPALLRAILRVRDGVDGGYWWVECATCEHGWQVPHYPQPPMRLMPPRSERRDGSEIEARRSCSRRRAESTRFLARTTWSLPA